MEAPSDGGNGLTALVVKTDLVDAESRMSGVKRLTSTSMLHDSDALRQRTAPKLMAKRLGVIHDGCSRWLFRKSAGAFKAIVKSTPFASIIPWTARAAPSGIPQSF